MSEEVFDDNYCVPKEKKCFAVNEMALRVHRRYATKQPQSLSNLDINQEKRMQKHYC